MRVLMGGIFLYAGYDKVLNPEQFALIVYNYRLLPDRLVNAVALVLPWVEIVAGAFLVLGLFPWASVTVYSGLVMVFMTGIVISLIRGLDITCGCFSTDPEGARMTWLTFFRDSLILVPGLLSFPVLRRITLFPSAKREGE